MDKMPILSIIFQSIPEAMIITFLTLVLYGFQGKVRFNRLLLLGVTFGIASYFVRMLPYPFGIHVIIQLFIQSILIKLIFKISLKKSFFVALTSHILLALVETVFVSIILIVLGITITDIMANPWLRIMVPWFHLSILLLTSFFVYKKGFLIGVLDNLEEERHKRKKNLVLLIIFMGLSVAFIFSFLAINTLVSSFSPVFDMNVNLRFLATFCIVILVIISSIIMVRKLLVLAELEVTVDSQQSLINNLNNLYTSIRTQRHDFIHHLQVMYSLLETKESEECKKYLNTLLVDVKEINEVVTVNNPAISALLQAKKAVAETKNIDFNLHLECKLDKLKIPALHIVTILANLIDNALDEVGKLEPPLRNANLIIKEYPSIYIFEIHNPRPIIPQELLDQIFKEGFSTKGENHSGLGLATVKKLTEKYKGEIGVTSNEEKGTVFTLVIPY